MDYFGLCDIRSCAQHVDAKELANKLWSRTLSLSNKAAEDYDRAPAILAKHDKVRDEFENLMRAFDRCGCYPKELRA